MMSLVDKLVTNPAGLIIAVLAAIFVAHTVSLVIKSVLRLPSGRFIEVSEFLVAIVLIVLLFKSVFYENLTDSQTRTLQHDPIVWTALFLGAMFLSVVLYMVDRRNNR